MADLKGLKQSKVSGNHADKRDPMSVPPHMRMDENIRNANIDAGSKLCERCDGTGNELFSMYRQCPDCKGMGIDMKLDSPEAKTKGNAKSPSNPTRGR